MKYHNKKTEVDGEVFDSRKEAIRYQELKLLQRTGEISNLQRQQTFELIPSQYEKKRLIERGVKYVADFTYIKDGNLVVEDAKGVRTKEYILKRKLMYWVHGIEIKEV
ncbi:MAG: DUF1064 domain-containing protein [Lachnospiraceae bacterium]|nr:DUF1064 domain-containing protein [Lachnospiraceae bacterium]MBP5462456.1 DUF1064 domain-containing protein [Lachnospiraceae bacterium]